MLNRHDFESACDKCGVALAKYRVTLHNGKELLLCLHHYFANEDALVTAGASAENLEPETESETESVS